MFYQTQGKVFSSESNKAEVLLHNMLCYNNNQIRYYAKKEVMKQTNPHNFNISIKVKKFGIFILYCAFLSQTTITFGRHPKQYQY